MTIQGIIDLLKKSGINSKKLVIKMLEEASASDLYELSRDCNTRIAEMRLNEVHQR